MAVIQHYAELGKLIAEAVLRVLVLHWKSYYSAFFVMLFNAANSQNYFLRTVLEQKWFYERLLLFGI